MASSSILPFHVEWALFLALLPTPTILNLLPHPMSGQDTAHLSTNSVIPSCSPEPSDHPNISVSGQIDRNSSPPSITPARTRAFSDDLSILRIPGQVDGMPETHLHKASLSLAVVQSLTFSPSLASLVKWTGCLKLISTQHPFCSHPRSLGHSLHLPHPWPIGRDA